MKILLHIILCFCALPVCAQLDSTILFAERLKAIDIHSDIVDIASQKVVSASRTLQAVEDLPFTVYVITKEDIRNNGYNTLVDALKMVPGIRVSQPGSGPDGETFLMRGLRGNTYTKILINNIPVKPIGIKGMPLGAQLPIRQAERIEVIFGPAASLYGADASAGVINIILKESERPLYTKADISFGAKGYSGMNILFGGKAGKGKRLLKYNVFGNYTAFDTRRVFKEYGELYMPKAYDPDSTFEKHPNYLVRDTVSDFPTLSNTPHLSRLFGIELNFGAFELTLINMYRRDHSSLGLNPSAYSYANPLNFIGETIYQAHLGYSRKKKNRALNIALNALLFESDKNSSYRIINNEFNDALLLAANSDLIDPRPLGQRVSLYYDRFISGNRYLYDRKTDISLETTWNVKLTNKLEWMTGITPRALLSKSEYFLRTPYPNFFEDHTRTSGGNNDAFEVGTFSQLFYNGSELKIMSGLQYNYSSDIPFSESKKLFPRLALLFKLTPKLSFRAFYGTAFRTPSTYFSKNSYTIRVGNYDWITLGNFSLKPEITKTEEVGFRWSGGEGFYADLTFFRSETENIIRSDLKYERVPLSTEIKGITLGYFNDGFSFSKVSGFQSVFSLRNIIPRFKLNASLHFTITNSEERLRGQLEDFIREQPRIISQLKLSFSPIKDISIYLDNLFVSESENKSTYENDLSSYNTLPQYYTLDMSLLGRLTDHFQINFKLKNVFNVDYAGLSATGTTDDLFWNQQSFRTWELGFSYRME